MGRRKSNKQAPLSKEGAEKKEEKVKKTYALPKSEGHSYAGDMEKVNIPDHLEKEIIELILKEHQTRKSLGVLSKRLTTKKLTDVYDSLFSAGFSQQQIQRAMSATVAVGGDLHDALDWLCLNTPNDQLPSGFSQTLQEEERKKSKPRFDSTQYWKEGVELAAGAIIVPAVPIKEKRELSPTVEVKDIKARILHYADMSSESSSDEEDPNNSYLRLISELETAKAEASYAKQSQNKKKHSEASKKIRELTLAKCEAEKQSKFNPGTKVLVHVPQKKAAVVDHEMEEIKEIMKECDSTAAKEVPTPSPLLSAGSLPNPQSSNCKLAASPAKKDGDEDCDDGFNLYGFDNLEASASATADVKKSSGGKADDVRQFEYTRQQWTGKHPKQFLIDWCRKHLPKSPPPKYHKIQDKFNRFKCRVSIERSVDDVLSVTPDILCQNAKEAEMLGCTLALYHLCHGQSVHTLLPPPYRAVWLEWLEAESSAKEQAKEKENKPRDQFVARLMKKLKMEEGGGSQSTQPPLVNEERKTASGSGDAEDRETDQVQDDWEAIVDKGIAEVEGNAKSKQKSTELTPKQKVPTSESLQHSLRRLHSSRSHQDLIAVREQLPVFQYRQSIMELVARENVVVVAGETGSGKSTQVPQFILEDCIFRGQGASCNIIVTQPRRISAVSLSSRVSEEIGESPRETRNNLCGFQIRFESRKCSSTHLVYCTTGVVLRQLQSDKDLSSVSHLIIDEVHERSVQSDFLLTIVKGLLERRPDLKVILMSATLDSDKFSAYFSGCNVLTIPGRTFPVQVYHIEDAIEMTGYVIDEDSPYTWKQSQLLEEESATAEVTGKRGETNQTTLHWTKEDIGDIDRTSLPADRYSKKTRNAVTRLNPSRINMDLIVELLKHLGSAAPYRDIDGAVLIFLPGLADIQELHETLTAERHFSDPKRYQIFALHSVLSSDDQNKVFSIPPKGVRKIVLATNIAETGITIPDIVFVIDSGKAKENRYSDTSQMSSLTEVFISKASAKQRQGRAGRVREGFCFRLFTADKFRKLADYTVPEIMRVPLEELCLTIMKCDLGNPEEFLAGCLDPPPSSSVQRAMALLGEVGACFTDTCSLTPLGHHLAALPVDVRVGKMLVFSAILGCLEPVAVIAAAMTTKSPFLVPLSRRDEASAVRQSLSAAASDHLTVYRAYCKWTKARSQGRKAEVDFCNSHFLKRNTLLEIQNVKDDLIKLVSNIGLNYTTSSPVKPFATDTSSMAMPDVLSISKVTSKTHELDQHTVAMVKAVLCAGLYSQVARVTPVDSATAAAHPGEKKPCLAETAQGHTQVHPSSVNRFLMLHSTAWLVYGEKVKVSRVYVRDTTLVSAYPLLLFGGDIKVHHLQKLLEIDNWIKYKAVARTGVIFKEMRKLFDKLLERKLASPGLNTTDDDLIKLITQLIKSEKPVVRL